MRKVVWRPRAHLDRQSIALYLGQECGNPKAALSAIREIDTAIDRVREFPELGRNFDVDLLSHHDYRCVLAGTYRVFYRFVDNQIIIYRVLHQRRDIDPRALVEFPA